MIPPCQITDAATIRRIRIALEQDALAFAQSEPEPATESRLPDYSKPGTRREYIPRGQGPRKRFAVH